MNRRQPRNRIGCAVGFVSRLGALSSSSWLRNPVGLGTESITAYIANAFANNSAGSLRVVHGGAKSVLRGTVEPFGTGVSLTLKIKKPGAGETVRVKVQPTLRTSLDGLMI